MAVASLVLGITSYITCGLTILPAVICGVLALDKIKKANGALVGRGQALAGIILGGACVFVLAIVGLLAAIAIPSFVQARQMALAMQCQNNLKQLGTACIQYATEHDGTLPAKLEELEPLLGENVKKIMVCPSSCSTNQSTYEFLLAGNKLTELRNPDRVPMIRESQRNHKRGYSCVFADGHVEFCPKLPTVAPETPR